MAGRWGIVVLVLVSGLLAACDDADPSSTPRTSATPDPGLGTAWQVDLSEKPFLAAAPNGGTPAIPLGDDVLVLTRRGLVALGATDGTPRWRTRLPADLCAAPRSADPTGVVAVLTGTGDDCSRVVAIDAARGQVLWNRPIPAAAGALGHTVAAGSDVVTVTGGCTGAARFAVDDGSLLSADDGDRGCTTSATDGSTIVTANGGRLTIVDAATGHVERRLAAPGLQRIGQLLDDDPLVVTAALDDGRTLVDLSGRRPSYLGADEGGYSGEVPAWARSGDLLWVQYDDRTIAGFDLAEGADAAELPLDVPGSLVGATDDAVWVTTDDASAPRLLRFPVADLRLPDEAGALPVAPDTAGPVRRSVLVGDLVVVVRDGRVDAVRLP